MRAARRSTDAVQFNKAFNKPYVLVGIIFRKLSTNIKKKAIKRWDVLGQAQGHGGQWSSLSNHQTHQYKMGSDHLRPVVQGRSCQKIKCH